MRGPRGRANLGWREGKRVQQVPTRATESRTELSSREILVTEGHLSGLHLSPLQMNG